VSASSLDRHLLLTIADSLTCATADLALLADVTDSRVLLAEVIALLDDLERHATRLDLVIARRAAAL
jgi:hypothetical protein